MGRAWARNENFWSKKRTDSGIELRELSDYIGVHRTTVCHYFTGQSKTPEDVAKKICDFFDVDYATGIDEFDKIRNDWVSRHSNSVHANPKSAKTSAVKSSDSIDDSIMEYLYGKIAYADFKDILTGNTPKTDIMKSLYGKVDYAMYAKIASAISG